MNFDELIATLQKTLGITVFMVTHDLDSLRSVCDRIAAIGEGKVLETGPMETMLASKHPWLQAYFHDARKLSSQRTSRQSRHDFSKTLAEASKSVGSD